MVGIIGKIWLEYSTITPFEVKVFTINDFEASAKYS